MNGLPITFIGSPIIFTGVAMILIAQPTLFVGTPMILTGSPTIFAGLPVILSGPPTVLTSELYFFLKRLINKNHKSRLVVFYSLVVIV